MIVTDKELDDYLVSQNWTRNDLTEEQLSSLRQNMEWVKNGGAILDGFLCFEKDLQQLRIQRQYSSIIVKSEEWDKLREMVACCEWTFAKSMPWCPHEYIVRTKCSLTEDDFVHFVKMQRNYGTVERWGTILPLTSTLMTTSIGRWVHHWRKRRLLIALRRVQSMTYISYMKE